MAALAQATETIRLGTLVTGMTYRHPSVLAAQAVTVDHISGGRVELAVGAAWNDDEHEELGIPFPPMKERAERLEEGVQVMRLLMTEDAVTFEGRHHSLDDATYHPRPIQTPYPPIWIGAEGEKIMLPVVARQADAWHSSGTLDELTRRNRLLDAMAEEAGRDPKSILRAADLSISEPWAEVMATAEGLQEAGFEYLVVGWPTEGWDRTKEFVKDVMPEIA
jgi:alkanesulfonate monooxygenase SsuD/methylene tetrahydromethanopterin reductase-like flavin-dependent oxidoreductase (luciferase family)